MHIFNFELIPPSALATAIFVLILFLIMSIGHISYWQDRRHRKRHQSMVPEAASAEPTLAVQRPGLPHQEEFHRAAAEALVHGRGSFPQQRSGQGH